MLMSIKSWPSAQESINLPPQATGGASSSSAVSGASIPGGQIRMAPQVPGVAQSGVQQSKQHYNFKIFLLKILLKNIQIFISFFKC